MPKKNPEPIAVRKPVKRTFESLVAKHKVTATEAAALRRALPVDKDGLIDPDEFTQGRKAWLAAPAGR